LKENDTSRNVLAVQVGGEMDYMFGLKDEWWGLKNADVRCECDYCNTEFAKFQGSKVDFMSTQYAKYLKSMIEAGAAVYNIPTYTCAAPKTYWNNDWRYAENSPLRKQIINRQNYFVGP